MSKLKKKTKSVKLPKPIKVKKEEEDRTLHSLAHYMDDRLELIKQIFGTLKPKTITNLAPDFMKTKNLDEIQELCLDELLCISTKRLTAIINGTECPSDTESSDDSDVEHQEEHISLEEISSDSELGASTSTKTKKKSTDSNLDHKTQIKNSTGNNENDGQISVLELLELQARARAIRSQLALEPVTKIEVDSDEDNNKNGLSSDKSVPKKKRKSHDAERVERSNTPTKHNKCNGTEVAKTKNSQELEKVPTKKIKLRRNYSNKEDLNLSSTKESKAEKVNFKPKMKKEAKVERISHSSSPDVITVVSEPVTLWISDNSDEENKKISALSTTKSAAPVDNSEADKNKVSKEDTIELAPPEEQEEGEIMESENDNNEKETVDEETTNAKETESKQDVESEDVKEAANTEKESEVQSDFDKEIPKNDMDSTDTKASPVRIETNQTVNLEDDDEQDDVISIEGGDLENEMIEHLEDDSKLFASASKKGEDSSEQSSKVIALDSSDDERHDSWRTRYMKSEKVTKVLAVSRLGKRVRDNIKKSKHSSAETPTETKDNSKDHLSLLNHEDGSVEQYKALIEINQRKN